MVTVEQLKCLPVAPTKYWERRLHLFEVDKVREHKLSLLFVDIELNMLCFAMCVHPQEYNR